MFTIKEAVDDDTHLLGTKRSWKKAARCNSGACVEVLLLSDVALIRDSKQPDPGVMIGLSADQFISFLNEVCGETDPHSSSDEASPIKIVLLEDGGTALKCASGKVTLTYDAAEWSTFVDGARSGDFRILQPA